MEIAIVTIILAVTLYLLISERIPIDLTAIGIMTVLTLSGILSPQEAVAGFANPAVITVGAMFLISQAMIRTGVVGNALVIGVESISPYMDWENRNVAVLFGDGAAAVVLEQTQAPEGLLGETLGCIADARHTLRVRGIGGAYVNAGVTLGDTLWDFNGQEIFKRAVKGMVSATESVMAKCGVSADDIDLVVPHQANLRIIMALAQRIGVPEQKLMLTVQRYGNMSAATVPVALVEALEEGRVAPGALILMPAFGGGLTLSSHLLRWGRRITPLETTDVDLPPCASTALELVNAIRAAKVPANRSLASLKAPVFSDIPNGAHDID
jgi:3-oxoacyl-[acyl-carrier-protein] synthase-3